MSRVYRTPIQVRFNDADALGHLNNTAYAVYAEQARVAFFVEHGSPVGSLILARIALDFRRQVRFGDEVAVETWVERIGNSSVALAQAVLAGGEVAAEVESVVVLFDYEAQRPRRVPDAVRGHLAPFVREGAAPA